MDAIHSLFYSQWLVKVDARVRVVDWMCKVCATHVTSNMHPAAACRDSCDNDDPILVKSSWTSDWFPPGSLDMRQLM